VVKLVVMCNIHTPTRTS